MHDDAIDHSTSGDAPGAKVMGAVLAAGAGSRYGKPKILAHDGDWLELAVAALRDGGCDEVVVAMGAAIVEPPRGASALIVEDWSKGVGHSVAAVLGEALARSGTYSVLLHTVDTPDVGRAVVSRVLDAAGHRADALVRAVFDGRPGHPVYLGADHLRPAVEVIGGDVGAQPYLRGHEVREVECSDLASGIDIDVPD